MTAFPYDATNLLGGAVRVLWASAESGGASIPAGPKDIFAQTLAGTYSPAGSAGAAWKDFGAARDSSSYERALDLTEWEIQQANAAVVQQVNTTTRSVSVSIAELTSAALAIIEQGTAGTIAGASGVSAQKTVGMGEIDSLKRYRIAFVSQRDRSAGLVVEPSSGPSRGRFVVGVGHSCTISADAASLEQAKAALSAVTVSFRFYPVAGQPAGEEYGKWFLEDAGTMT